MSKQTNTGHQGSNPKPLRSSYYHTKLIKSRPYPQPCNCSYKCQRFNQQKPNVGLIHHAIAVFSHLYGRHPNGFGKTVHLAAFLGFLAFVIITFKSEISLILTSITETNTSEMYAKPKPVKDEIPQAGQSLGDGPTILK